MRRSRPLRRGNGGNCPKFRPEPFSTLPLSLLPPLFSPILRPFRTIFTSSEHLQCYLLKHMSCAPTRRVNPVKTVFLCARPRGCRANFLASDCSAGRCAAFFVAENSKTNRTPEKRRRRWCCTACWALLPTGSQCIPPNTRVSVPVRLLLPPLTAFPASFAHESRTVV